MKIVDAHAHIYSPDRRRYPTIEYPREPGEPAAAEDLKLRMDEAGIERAVFIQTSTFYGFDNRYVMDATRASESWGTGVVTLDPDDATHLDVLEDAVRNHGVRGLRGIPDGINRLSTPNVSRLWSKARDLGIPVNVLVQGDLDRVSEIERAATDIDGLRLVLDHLLGLNSARLQAETLYALKRLAEYPNVYAKVTPGAFGSQEIFPHRDMHDPLKRTIGYFGPERCLWGSSFPNALWTKGTSYAQGLSLITDELGLSESEQEAVLSTTALALWFPDEG